MRLPFFIAASAMLFAAGCSTMRPAKPVSTEKGPKVVCILFKDTNFKTEVAGKVTAALSAQGFRVVTGTPSQRKAVKAADYGAVVYMAEYWAWHTPGHAKRYFQDNDEAANILIVVTSGDPVVTIKKPFDAVTTASKPDRVEPVAQEILTRLGKIVK